jgi:hypothetical protein
MRFEMDEGPANIAAMRNGRNALKSVGLRMKILDLVVCTIFALTNL